MREDNSSESGTDKALQVSWLQLQEKRQAIKTVRLLLASYCWLSWSTKPYSLSKLAVDVNYPRHFFFVVVDAGKKTYTG
jgi:hypothetical protein